ncbi:hypothetical protein ACFWDI_37010 [Streptomyces sp. NPDC060064]
MSPGCSSGLLPVVHRPVVTVTRWDTVDTLASPVVGPLAIRTR